MIAACPECRTQFRVDPGRLGDGGVRLRCTQCQTVFRVRAPEAPAATPATSAPAAPVPSMEVPEVPMPEAPASEASEPPPAAPTMPPSPAAAEGVPPAVEPAPPVAESPPSEPAAPGEWNDRLVLIATPDAENAKRWVEALRGWGLEAESAHDGVEALLKIHRLWPAAVVLDPQLPKMFGFQVCEVVKRNEALRRIGVVLIGAIHHPDRYRRNPEELYGADAYVEEPDLPEALAPILRDMGLPIGPVAEPPSVDVAPGPSPDLTLPPPLPPEATLPPAANVAPPAESDASPVVDVATPDPGLTLPPPIPQEMTLPPSPGDGSLSSQGIAPQPTAPVELVPEPVTPEPVVAAPEPVLTAPSPEPVTAAPAAEPLNSAEYDILDPDATVNEVTGSGPVDLSPVAEPESALDAAFETALEPEAPVAAQAEPPAATPNEADPEFEKAERLARIIVSDVVLYNEDKFRSACEAGNVVEAMEADLADGRAHFASRVPEHVRNARDFLAAELLRVAKSRGMA